MFLCQFHEYLAKYFTWFGISNEVDIIIADFKRLQVDQDFFWNAFWYTYSFIEVLKILTLSWVDTRQRQNLSLKL